MIHLMKLIKDKEKMKRLGKNFAFYLGIIVFTLFLVETVNFYLLRCIFASGSSMENTITDRSLVWVSRSAFVKEEPQRGDIVVLGVEKAERTYWYDFGQALKGNLITQLITFGKIDVEENYIKRIIGVEGDVVTIENNQVYLNGELLEENYVKNSENVDYLEYFKEYAEYVLEYEEERLDSGLMISQYKSYQYSGSISWTVGEGEIFVMGDNRQDSSDSRVFGTFPVECVVGKVMGKKYGKKN